MRVINLCEEKGEEELAKEAARHFVEHPKHHTYGNLKSGSFLAIRFGLGEDCVVVVKIDSMHEPVNYQYLISKMKEE